VAFAHGGGADRAFAEQIATAARPCPVSCSGPGGVGSRPSAPVRGRRHACRLVVARTALANAAWRGAAEVAEQDVAIGVRLALPHRKRRDPFDEPGLDDDQLAEALRDAADQLDQPTPIPTGPDGGQTPPPDDTPTAARRSTPDQRPTPNRTGAGHRRSTRSPARLDQGPNGDPRPMANPSGGPRPNSHLPRPRRPFVLAVAGARRRRRRARSAVACPRRVRRTVRPPTSARRTAPACT